ncbi:MAG: hypothetical protein KatS3mg105_4770 [Gemmatales bacterium]|nr:MAG: hypothetical protein KatS3mg105_4770 [Gemmatales bacterium]
MPSFERMSEAHFFRHHPHFRNSSHFLPSLSSGLLSPEASECSDYAEAQEASATPTPNCNQSPFPFSDDTNFRRQIHETDFSMRVLLVRKEFNILALVKGNERFVYVFNDSSRQQLIDVFRDHAANPDLSFSWFDAAVLTEKTREQAVVRTDQMSQPRL